MPKLTKRFIDSIPPEKKDKVFWDDELPCFGLRVKPSGSKSFLIQYRNTACRSRRLTLGSYGRLTPDEARKQARLKLADVTRGKDPVEEKQKVRKTVTLKELALRYVEQHATTKKKPTSIYEDKRLLNKIILPALGSKPVNGVTRTDVAHLHHSLRARPYQANRLLSLLSMMFRLAEAWGLREDGTNPCRHIQKFKERKRERFLSGEELARLGRVLAEAEEKNEELPSALTALRLLLFTGARRGEILGLKWTDVDFERGILRIPDSKTGFKVIYLSESVIKTLENAPRVEGNPFVCFGTRGDNHLSSAKLHTVWARIRKRAGLEDVRLHDMRHSFAGVGASGGMGLPVLGASLGHTQASTTQRYAHLVADPLRRAAEEISSEIERAMKQTPKVVPLKR